YSGEVFEQRLFSINQSADSFLPPLSGMAQNLFPYTVRDAATITVRQIANPVAVTAVPGGGIDHARAGATGRASIENNIACPFRTHQRDANSVQELNSDPNRTNAGFRFEPTRLLRSGVGNQKPPQRSF